MGAVTGHSVRISRVEVGKDGAEPPWERVGSEPVVDTGELLVVCESGVSGYTPGKSAPTDLPCNVQGLFIG